MLDTQSLKPNLPQPEATSPPATEFAVQEVAPPPTYNSYERTLRSTAYCDTYSGIGLARPGTVAFNDEPYGTQIDVLTGPLAGKRFINEDTYGWGTGIDFWFDSCGAAEQYGAPTVTIRVYRPES